MPDRGKSRVFIIRDGDAPCANKFFAVVAIALSLSCGVHGVTQEQRTGVEVAGTGRMEMQTRRTRILRKEPVLLLGSLEEGATREESVEEAKIEVAEAALAVQKQEALEAVVAAAQEVSHEREMEERAEDHLRSAAQALDEVNRQSNAMPVASLLETEKSNKTAKPACITCGCLFMDRHGDKDNCDATYTLRQLVEKWLSPNSTVMEFGAMYGAASCAIAKQQHNSGKLVAVEPDHRLWATLEMNRAANKCNFTTVRGFLGDRDMLAVEKEEAMQFWPVSGGTQQGPQDNIVPHLTFKETQTRYFKNFDSAIIDCDGCLSSILAQNVELFPQLGLVLVTENAAGVGTPGLHELEKFKQLGHFKEVDVVNGHHVLRRNCGTVENCFKPFSTPASLVVEPAKDGSAQPPVKP